MLSYHFLYYWVDFLQKLKYSAILNASKDRQLTECDTTLSPPLAGVRVLDLSTVVAGPFGSGQLARLGADVIRIVPPGKAVSGDPDPDLTIGLSDGFYYALQRGKRTFEIDLKSQEGKTQFLELAQQSDIVYDNFRPGVTARLGIDYMSLSAEKPDIITCSISGFGLEGPWSSVAAYDITMQALAGGMSITGNGDPAGEPVRWGVPIGDLAGSLYAVIAVLAALQERDQTGNGQMIDIALLDCQLAFNTYRVPQAFGMGAKFSSGAPRRGGAGTVPYGPFQCGDGQWLAIGVASNFWPGFCTAMSRPDLQSDPSFLTLRDRQANQADLDFVLEQMFITRTSDEWSKRLAAKGVPHGRVNTIAQAFADPSAKARGMLETITDKWGRNILVAGSPLNFENTPLSDCEAPADASADVAAIQNMLSTKKEGAR